MMNKKRVAVHCPSEKDVKIILSTDPDKLCYGLNRKTYKEYWSNYRENTVIIPFRRLYGDLKYTETKPEYHDPVITVEQFLELFYPELSVEGRKDNPNLLNEGDLLTPKSSPYSVLLMVVRNQHSENYRFIKCIILKNDTDLIIDHEKRVARTVEVNIEDCDIIKDMKLSLKLIES